MANSIRDELILGDPEFANLIDELTEQMQSHRELDLEDYLKRYPQYADQLEQLVPAMEMLIYQGSTPGESDTGQPEPQSSAPLGTTGGKLGDFRIIREIGRGGMGVVYEVEQLSLKRRMALKVLPFAGILDEQALKRFKNEALAAATLNHPNIVQVHSVGCDRGVHYFAMQLIEGQTLADTITELRRIRKHRSSEQADEIANVGSLSIAIATGSLETPANDDDFPITEPSKSEPATSPTPDTKREVQAALSTVPSLETRAYFRSVANLGIQAAEALEHAHANGISHRDIKPGNLMIDGAGKLWVTDFGLARIEASAPMTMTGDMLGTLRYMCPEMAAGGRERLVVDQRTDIYSLGVTLYELLTLQPAFEGKDRKELFKKIIFEEPRSPRRISKNIPANLETIVLKAMRKDPAGRYATAGELANDLKRFLDNEPIRAKPPTLVERTHMWSRRNRTIVVAAAILLILVTVGSLIATGLVWQEQVRTANALHESRENEKKANENAAETRAIFSFLVDDMLGSASPTRPREDPITVAEVLANAEKNIKGAFDDQPKIEAAIRNVIGFTYQKLGNYDTAERQFRLALAIVEQQYGATHNARLKITRDLSWVLVINGKHDEARDFAERVLEIRRSDPDSSASDMIDAIRNLSFVCQHQGRFDEQLKLSQEVYEISREEFDAEDSRTLNAMNDFAAGLQARGRSAEARDLFEKLLAIQQKVLDPQHLNTARTMLNLSIVLGRTDDPAKAYEYNVKAVDIFNQIIAPEHRYLIVAKHVQIELLISLNRLSEARQLSQEMNSTGDLALLDLKEGKYSAAEKAYKKILQNLRNDLGEDNPKTLGTWSSLALAISKQGRFEEARQHYNEILEIQRVKYGETHTKTADTMNRLAIVQMQLGNLADADELLQQVISIRSNSLGEKSSFTLDAMYNRANLLGRQRNFEEARTLHERVFLLRKEALPPKHRSTLYSMQSVAGIACTQGRLDEAHALFAEMQEIYPEVFGPNHPSTVNMESNLAILLLDEGRFEQAKGLALQNLEKRKEMKENQSILTLLSTKATLAQSLDGLEQYEMARPLWQEIELVARQEKIRSPDMSRVAQGFALHLASAPDPPVAELDRALELATESTELDPAYGESWRALGVVHAASHHWKESRNAFNKAIALGCPRQLLNSAMLERIDNDVNRSDEDFQQLMEFVRAHSK